LGWRSDEASEGGLVSVLGLRSIDRRAAGGATGGGKVVAGKVGVGLGIVPYVAAAHLDVGDGGARGVGDVAVNEGVGAVGAVSRRFDKGGVAGSGVEHRIVHRSEVTDALVLKSETLKVQSLQR